MIILNIHLLNLKYVMFMTVILKENKNLREKTYIVKQGKSGDQSIPDTNYEERNEPGQVSALSVLVQPFIYLFIFFLSLFIVVSSLMGRTLFLFK